MRTWVPEFLVDDDTPSPPGKPFPGDWLVRDEHQHLTLGGGRGDEAIPISVGDTFDFLGSTDGKEDDFATRFKLAERDGSLTFEQVARDAPAAEPEDDEE